MKKKVEPLLKDEVETFPFLDKKSTIDLKIDRPFITTIIVTIIVILFVGNSLYPFYIGFKYYDLRFEKVATETEETETISLNSYILNNTWEKINASHDNLLSNVFPVIYKEAMVNVTSLNNEQKLWIVLNNLNLTCDNLKISTTDEELQNMAKNIFNQELDLSLLDSMTGLTINKDANNVYNIIANACNPSNDFVYKKIIKATTKDDELYIYEKFGYFINIDPKKYSVYSNALKTGNLLTTFTDEENKKNFNNPDILKTYKWTYKKSNDNNYYFISVTPE